MAYENADQYTSLDQNRPSTIVGDEVKPKTFDGVSGAPELPVGTPVAFNPNTGFWEQWSAGISEVSTITSDRTGGTFTITNGGVFGSMLSTPIINPPQSAILGMHATKERPVVENGQIVIRPVMYLALSYDHRIVDGSGAVTFLKTIKELLEDPARMLLDV